MFIKGSKTRNLLPGVYFILVLLFLYLPIIVVMVFSFNDSEMNATWVGFTLRWYDKLFQNEGIARSLKTSLILGGSSTVISTLVATLAGIGFYKYKFKGRQGIDLLFYIPMVIPALLLGVALLLFFTTFKMPLGMGTLIIAHVTFCTPFALTIIKARLEGFDKSIEEAAMDLGAGQIKTFITVIFPNIFPGIVSAAFMAFTISLDDVMTSFFVSGAGDVTLPLHIYSLVKIGVKPEINALSTLMILGTLTIGISSQLMRKKETN